MRPDDKMLMLGASLVALPVHSDERGVLGVIEPDGGLDFEVRRVFHITVDDPDVVRADHASNEIQLIAVVRGDVTVDLDNGTQTTSVRLTSDGEGLRIDRGVWRRLRGFQPGTILLVVSDRIYAETKHFPTPRPELREPQEAIA